MSMSREEALAGEEDGRYPDLRQRCAWPEGEFSFRDEPGEHDPCYVVMPDGAMLAVNHNAREGVDIARAKFIVDACNAALHPSSQGVGTLGRDNLTTKVCLYSDGCPPDGPVCHLCAHVQPSTNGAA